MTQLDLFDWVNGLVEIGKPCRHCLEWNNFKQEDVWWDEELVYKDYRCKTTIKDELGHSVAECGGTETVIKMYRSDDE